MTLNYNEFPLDQIEFVTVAEEHEIPNGKRMLLQIDDYDIVVFNIAGKYFAIGNVCSHDSGPIGDGEISSEYPGDIVCPRHGARFEIANGAAKSLPAIDPIPAYPVKVIDGQIQVGVPL